MYIIIIIYYFTVKLLYANHILAWFGPTETLAVSVESFCPLNVLYQSFCVLNTLVLHLFERRMRHWALRFAVYKGSCTIEMPIHIIITIVIIKLSLQPWVGFASKGKHFDEEIFTQWLPHAESLYIYIYIYITFSSLSCLYLALFRSFLQLSLFVKTAKQLSSQPTLRYVTEPPQPESLSRLLSAE